jgi:hypothetical protein
MEPTEFAAKLGGQQPLASKRRIDDLDVHMELQDAALVWLDANFKTGTISLPKGCAVMVHIIRSPPKP